MIHVLVVDDKKEQNQVICTYLMKNNIHAVGCTSPHRHTMCSLRDILTSSSSIS